MQHLNLEQVRHQLNLASDEGDDAQLTSYATAAELIVESHVQCPIVAVNPDDGTEVVVMDDALRVAMLLLVGHFYLNRESTSTMDLKATPMAYQMILNTKVSLMAEGV